LFMVLEAVLIDVFFKMMGLGASKSLQSRADSQSVNQQKSGINLSDSKGTPDPSKAQAATARRQDVKAPAKKSKAASKPAPKAKASAKAVAKPAAKKAAKPVAKAAAKPVAKAPAAKTKAVAKPAAKAASKPSPKPSPKPAAKKAVSKPVAKPSPKTKAAAKPAAKPVAKPASKPVSKPAGKATAKPAAKPVAKPASKPISKAPVKTSAKPIPQAAVKAAAKPVAKPAAKPPAKAVDKAPAKAAPASAAPAKTAAKAPFTPPPSPPKTKAGSRVVPSYAPSAANMSPHGGNTAAKASFTMSAPVLAPPPQLVVKKDPKLAGNWKTKSPDQLTDAEVIAMPDSEYMNAKQLAFFRLKLVALKNGILSNAGETTEHLREDTSIVPDPADRATIEEEHALELRTRDRERKLLKKIEQSIQSIDAEEYGYCDETGEPIGVARLIARPTATLSIEAQQRRELKQKMFGD
jgi:DnaK suppressor protein